MFTLQFAIDVLSMNLNSIPCQKHMQCEADPFKKKFWIKASNNHLITFVILFTRRGPHPASLSHNEARGLVARAVVNIFFSKLNQMLFGFHHTFCHYNTINNCWGDVSRFSANFCWKWFTSRAIQPASTWPKSSMCGGSQWNLAGTWETCWCTTVSYLYKDGCLERTGS